MTKLVIIQREQRPVSVLRINCKKKSLGKKDNDKYNILKQSLKVVTRQYCKESSICGLKHLVGNNVSYFERWIWKLTMIGSLFCSISLVWLTFDKYYKAPLITTELPQGIPVNNIIFPAIGICSANRISRKAITELARKLLQEERNQNYTEHEMLSLLRGLGKMYNLETLEEDPKMILLHEALGQYNLRHILRDLTPRCEEIILKCSWNEVPTNCTSLFNFRLTMNGYCCTFNYLRKSDDALNINITNIDIDDSYNYGNKSAFDFDQGLKLLLRSDHSDDFFSKTNVEGTLLQITDAYDFPDEPSGSYASLIVGPSVELSVEVFASQIKASRDIQHIPVSLRGCLFNDESSYLSFYTYSDCLLKCRLIFLSEKCNCTPFNMPKIVDSRTCDISDVQCLKKFYAQSIRARPENVHPIPPELELHLVGGGISCPMCYPTCSKTAYSYETSYTEIYHNFLNSVGNRYLDPWLHGANFTDTSILNVRYGSEIAKYFEQNVIMKWFDLFSNIGSTCGFVTGFSFLSLMEFIYFFTFKLASEVKMRRKSNKNVVWPNRQPFKPTRSIRYQSLYWNEFNVNKHVVNNSM